MQHQLWRNSLEVATHTPTVSPGEVCVFMEWFSKPPWPEGMMLMFRGSRSPIPCPSCSCPLAVGVTPAHPLSLAVEVAPAHPCPSCPCPFQWRWLQPTAALPASLSPRCWRALAPVEWLWEHMEHPTPFPHSHFLSSPLLWHFLAAAQTCLPRNAIHWMWVQPPASSNNIWWYPFLVINNLPQNQKVPTVLRTFFFFFLHIHASLIFLAFFFLPVCFSSICLIYEFINFPRTFASSMICLCFSNREWNQDCWMMPIAKAWLTAEKCFFGEKLSFAACVLSSEDDFLWGLGHISSQHSTSG